MTTTERVTRYVVTYVHPRDGMRTLTAAAQGRNTFATREEAESHLRAMLLNNSAGTLDNVYGTNPRFEVRPCECWLVHFDPVGVYFD